jgi:CheY-like chemotaxis protein
MSSSSLSYPIDSLHNGHIMLLYESDDKRNTTTIDLINEGLKNNYFCIYASVDIDNSKGISLIDSFSSKIINYKENVQNENLKFINFKPSYESVLRGDYTLVEELKSKLEHILDKRLYEGKKDKILIFADAACCLSENRHFSECIDLEKWWQTIHSYWIKNNKNITVICPHPKHAFKDSEQYIKSKISASHNITINIEDEQCSYRLARRNRQKIKILIAEPESDLRYVYREYLNGLGLNIQIVENGSKCIEYLLDSKDTGEAKEEEGFDMVILDSHLPDINGIEVIKQIREEMPNQRIVFTTTHPLSKINTMVRPFGIETDDILVKPFNFRQLLSTIKPSITTR